MDELAEKLGRFRVSDSRRPEAAAEPATTETRKDDQTSNDEVRKFKISIRSGILSNQIYNVYDFFRQSKEVFLIKRTLRKFIYDCFKSELKHVDVFMVGSSVNGFGSRSSALDLCLLRHVKEEEDHEVLLMVIGVFSLKPELKDLQLQFMTADKPFQLNLTDQTGLIEINLDVNKPLFIRNTQLIRCYSRIDDRAQPLASAVRAWAESSELNELSNYNLVLMLIHYLQIGCFPAVLPVLQQILPNSFLPDSDVRELDDVRLPPFRSANKQSLGELFIGFLDYYGNRFDYEHNVISIRNDWTIRRSDTVKERKTLLAGSGLTGQAEFDIQKSALFDLIYIEDPIDLSNTAASVTHPAALTGLKENFRNSHTRLEENKNLLSIVDLRLLLGI